MTPEQIIQRLNKAGITTEQLEALAEGRAWVCEWVELPKGLTYPDCCNHIDDSDKPIIDYHTMKHITFNGSAIVPTPKEEE